MGTVGVIYWVECMRDVNSGCDILGRLYAGWEPWV